VRSLRRHTPAVAVGLVVAAAAAGAGGWLAVGGGNGRAPTQHEYLAEVSSICRRYARRLAQVPGPSDIAAYGEVASGLGQALPLMQAQSAAMQAVPAPRPLAPRLERLFALSRRSIADLASALSAARRRDLGEMGRGLVQSALLRARLHALAAAIGIRCYVN
jgi:hypothetical protein